MSSPKEDDPKGLYEVREDLLLYIDVNVYEDVSDKEPGNSFATTLRLFRIASYSCEEIPDLVECPEEVESEPEYIIEIPEEPEEKEDIPSN